MCQPNAIEQQQQQNHNRKKNTATVFYTTTLLWSPLITAMCFEKVLKTTSNITAPF